MITRDFQDLKLSGLGLGMMRLPIVDGDDTKPDFDAVCAMVDEALASGINYFDTAWPYHGGNSEIIAGKALGRHDRASYYLASKFPGFNEELMAKAEEIFEEQLQKCQTPYFDFYLLHNVYEKNVDGYIDPKYGILEYLLEQKKNGRIKHLGFSCHGDMEVIKKFLAVYGPYMEFCQLQVNYLDWDFQDAKGKVEYMNSLGIPVWVMEPLRGGKLVKASPEMTALMKSMRPSAPVHEWAFRFLQSIPGVTMVLSGMSNMEQLKDNIAIWNTDEPLTEEEKEKLLAGMEAEKDRVGVPCTACRYCTEHCPQGLAIPNLISMYNEHMYTGGGKYKSWNMDNLPEEQRPTACIGCRSCEQACPQMIPISEVFAKFSELMNM